ncbi:MAG: tandem-95 repeat protein [Verrucomicrobiae bacterium]|nr:tandem-95 repeat protein [Verrucomicrobiae bacterium]
MAEIPDSLRRTFRHALLFVALAVTVGLGAPGARGAGSTGFRYQIPHASLGGGGGHAGSESFAKVASMESLGGAAQNSSGRFHVRLGHAAQANHPPRAAAQEIFLTEGTVAPIALAVVDVDGGPLTFELVSGPERGTLGGTFPEVRYTPAAGFRGTDRFTYRVRDDHGHLATATVTLQVLRSDNRAPIAVDLAFTTDEDTPVGVRLLAGDPDGDPMTFRIVTPPSLGRLSGTMPSLVYAPFQDVHGTDTFTYVATDGLLTSAPATVRIVIRPVNDPPVAGSMSVTLLQDGAVGLVLGAIDVDGDALRFEIVTPPAHGVLSGTPPGVVYRPNAGFAGTDRFEFRAHDGQAASALATVTLRVLAVEPREPRFEGGVVAGGFALRWSGLPDGGYWIETSLDLRGWEVLTSGTVTGGVFELIDPEFAERPFRFYRLGRGISGGIDP